MILTTSYFFGVCAQTLLRLFAGSGQREVLHLSEVHVWWRRRSLLQDEPLQLSRPPVGAVVERRTRVVTLCFGQSQHRIYIQILSTLFKLRCRASKCSVLHRSFVGRRAAAVDEAADRRRTATSDADASRVAAVVASVHGERRAWLVHHDHGLQRAGPPSLPVARRLGVGL